MNAVAIIGVVSAFSLVFLWLLVLCAEKGVHPFRRVRQGFRHLAPWEKTLLFIFVGVWIAFASVKDGTNQMENVELKMENGVRADSILHSPFYTLHSDVLGAPQPITGEDVAQMWRIDTATDATAFAEPTANAVTNLDWRDYGGMSDSLRIKPNGWWFPYGDKTTTGLTVFENGDFRPNVKTHFFPPPFDAKLSLLPKWNWGLLPDGGESVFWHEHTPSNSLVLTWHNALYNRDLNSPTNFQAELFADGRFDYRYPDRTVQYAPVFPFDWDGDGLANEVDPEPLVAGPDAHGTNAEWYNRVCGNVFMAFAGPDGVDLEPKSAEVNTNAYYFVDVVAEGIAPVHFVADGPSRLGSPAVIAQAGETNRVPLLIGATYSVTSTVPLQIFAPAEAVVDAQGRNDGGKWTFGISWPVTMGYTLVDGLAVPDVSDSDRLQGTFSWTGGCCVRHVGDAMQFCCQGCGCGGCTANVNYLYEGYLLATQGPSCGCSSEHEGAPHVETDAGGGVSVEFDRKAVIFEDDYYNSPTEHVARCSTKTILTLRANGGIHGGTLSVTTRNLSRLNLDEGTRPLGTRTLAPYELYEAVSTNSGLRASSNIRDVEVEATFTENGTGERVAVHTATTAVRVELTAEMTAPENPSEHRHRLGVCEPVKLRHWPKDVEVKWEISGNALDTAVEVESGFHRLELPDNLNYFSTGLLCEVLKVGYYPSIALVAPQGILCTECWWDGDTKWPKNDEQIGKAGYVGMYLRLFITPLDVSFGNIDAQESPSTNETHTAYFNILEGTDYISHTDGAGAGDWHCVGTNNYFTTDHAGCRNCPQPWIDDSRHVWRVPHAWRKKTKNGQPWFNTESKAGEFYTDCEQVFTLNAEGTVGVEKHGKSISRTTNNCVRVQGTVVYGKGE